MQGGERCQARIIIAAISSLPGVGQVDENYWENGEIFKYNLSSLKLIKKYTAPSDGNRHFHTYGIDGLYFIDNNLYAIQNELLTQVSRF